MVLPGANAAGGRKQIDNLDQQLMSKLTKRVVDAAEVRVREYFIWDGDLPGFGCASCPAVASDTLYSTAPGDARAASALDPAPCCPANRHVAGRSPSLLRPRMATILRAARCRSACHHVKELAERFTKEHIDLRLKPSTAKGYKLERFVIPRLGNHRVNEVTRADIAQLHHDFRHIAYDANRCLENDLQDVQPGRDVGPAAGRMNPRKHIKKYPEEKPRAFLEPRRASTRR